MAKRKAGRKSEAHADPPVHPFDRLHGTDTSGLLPASWLAESLGEGTTVRLTDLTAYYGVAPSILRQLIEVWQELAPLAPLEDTVFYDVGAGKGRALLLAAEFPFLRLEGVELNATLASVAETNLNLWRRRPEHRNAPPVRIVCASATRHRLPPEPVLAFLFHPFERAVLRRFLRHVEHSLVRHLRPFDLIYVNAEHDSVLDHHPQFQRLWMGRVAMSAEDHKADLAEIENQSEYGSTGDELCAIYRYRAQGRTDERESEI